MIKSWQASGLATLVAVAVSVTFPLSAVGGAAPPGATARCKDSTYSYSQHHSGTCSHHGGVAQWLAGTATPAAPAVPAAPRPSTVQVSLGRTVLVAGRKKTADCHLGALPDRRCSPGAYYSGLTKKTLCSRSFHTSSIRDVPESEKHQVETEYGLAPKGYGRTMEVDHIVSLELGGSNAVANLYPEKANAAPGFHVKDKLENTLHAWVCAGKISLRATQVGIATNWEKLYRRVYGVVPR